MGRKVFNWKCTVILICCLCFTFSCRSLLIPFCSGSPLCGSFQIYRYPDVQEAILDVIEGQVNLRDSTSSEHFTNIKRHAPILAKSMLDNTTDGKLDKHPGRVIKFLLHHINELFDKYDIPANNKYGQPCSNPYEFFPGFPVTLGKAYYAMDKEPVSKDAYCRKLTGAHPTLSPGIFTVFCRHRICLGFSLMTSAESPKTPFDIFIRRFSPFLPNMRIFYDNSCNLHQYALNREPKRFSETIFLIDRLHYQDHKACTEGYSTSAYNSDPSIKAINTQVNEQANSDLRNLSKQVTHMRPDNVMLHTKIFLAERNRRMKVAKV